MQPVITVSHVSKSYILDKLRPRTLKEAFVAAFRLKARPRSTHRALQDVSFTIFRGETVGLIGSNGSGKSTILKLLSGIMRPNEGQVRIEGRISPLLELGAGFHPELSGRDNIFLNGALLGIKRERLLALYDHIVDFAELRPFIDQPVRTYSSGMYVRLAFAIAINVDPDILLVDEVLAVGDTAFKHKCMREIGRIRDAGKTIVLVSHDDKQIRAMCSRVIWLDRGVLRMVGTPNEVLPAYRASQAETAAATGPGELSVHDLQLLDAHGEPVGAIESGAPFQVAFRWESDQALKLRWMLLIHRPDDHLACAGSYSEPLALMPGAGRQTFTPAGAWQLAPGDYEAQLVPEVDGEGRFEAMCRYPFTVTAEAAWPGLVPLAGMWEAAPSLGARPTAASDPGRPA